MKSGAEAEFNTKELLDKLNAFKQLLIAFGSNTEDNKHLIQALNINLQGQLIVYGNPVFKVLNDLEDKFDWENTPEQSAALRLATLMFILFNKSHIDKLISILNLEISDDNTFENKGR
jgi:hypothetical protein